jgi:uncharacterized protein YceH (UPF0502 family)
MAMNPPDLSLLEARILGVLVEKQHTVPDIYPLSLNALTAGCNQKTSRDPLLHASEAEVQAGIERLRGASLVVESSGGRVMRYTHNVERVLGLPSQAVALLAAMMLRGPQNVGELRINCDRLHRFADASAVEGFLNELAERSAGALVVMLPRLPGARENRWMHLLSGPPADLAAEADASAFPRRDDALQADIAELRQSVGELRDEITLLKAALARLRTSPESDGT